MIILLVAGGAALLVRRNEPDLKLILTGTPGTSFRGTVEVDGVAQEVAGALPAEFRFRGTKLAYAIKTVDGGPKDEISIAKFVNDFSCGGTGGRAGVVGGLIVSKSARTWLSGLGIRAPEATWWDAVIQFEQRDREITLSPDSGRILWAPPP